LWLEHEYLPEGKEARQVPGERFLNNVQVYRVQAEQLFARANDHDIFALEVPQNGPLPSFYKNLAQQERTLAEQLNRVATRVALMHPDRLGR
jgi:hypothetical protein